MRQKIASKLHSSKRIFLAGTAGPVEDFLTKREVIDKILCFQEEVYMCVFLDRVPKSEAINRLYQGRIPEDKPTNHKLAVMFASDGAYKDFAKIFEYYNAMIAKFKEEKKVLPKAALVSIFILKTIAKIIEGVTFFLRFVVGGVFPSLTFSDLSRRSVRQEGQAAG